MMYSRPKYVFFNDYKEKYKEKYKKNIKKKNRHLNIFTTVLSNKCCAQNSQNEQFLSFV